MLLLQLNSKSLNQQYILLCISTYFPTSKIKNRSPIVDLIMHRFYSRSIYHKYTIICCIKVLFQNLQSLNLFTMTHKFRMHSQQNQLNKHVLCTRKSLIVWFSHRKRKLNFLVVNCEII